MVASRGPRLAPASELNPRAPPLASTRSPGPIAWKSHRNSLSSHESKKQNNLLSDFKRIPGTRPRVLPQVVLPAAAAPLRTADGRARGLKTHLFVVPREDRRSTFSWFLLLEFTPFRARSSLIVPVEMCVCARARSMDQKPTLMEDTHFERGHTHARKHAHTRTPAHTHARTHARSFLSLLSLFSLSLSLSRSLSLPLSVSLPLSPSLSLSLPLPLSPLPLSLSLAHSWFQVDVENLPGIMLEVCCPLSFARGGWECDTLEAEILWTNGYSLGFPPHSSLEAHLRTHRGE